MFNQPTNTKKIPKIQSDLQNGWILLSLIVLLGVIEEFDIWKRVGKLGGVGNEIFTTKKACYMTY